MNCTGERLGIVSLAPLAAHVSEIVPSSWGE
jgi:hypothetical protein